MYDGNAGWYVDQSAYTKLRFYGHYEGVTYFYCYI